MDFGCSGYGGSRDYKFRNEVSVNDTTLNLKVDGRIHEKSTHIGPSLDPFEVHYGVFRTSIKGEIKIYNTDSVPQDLEQAKSMVFKLLSIPSVIPYAKKDFLSVPKGRPSDEVIWGRKNNVEGFLESQKFVENGFYKVPVGIQYPFFSPVVSATEFVIKPNSNEIELYGNFVDLIPVPKKTLGSTEYKSLGVLVENSEDIEDLVRKHFHSGLGLNFLEFCSKL